MTFVQALTDFVLPNGVKVRAGAVFPLPDELAKELITGGKAKLRQPPAIREIKAADYAFGSTPPIDAPIQGTWWREPTAPRLERAFIPGAYEDRDNFIRNLVTVGYGWPGWWWGGPGSGTGEGVPPVTPTPSAIGRSPVLTLPQLKLHLRIEPEETVEDTLLLDLEMAARLHAENYLRYQIDEGVGENIKHAMLFLIGHYYRNREAVTLGTTMKSDPMALAFQALLYPERDFPHY